MIEPRWKNRIEELRKQVPIVEAQVAATSDPDMQQKRQQELMDLRGRVAWMESTLIAINISEAQNEARDFAKWSFDIIPHRDLIKKALRTPAQESFTRGCFQEA